MASGDDRREGYVHVDLRADVADVVADVRRLPFPDRCACEVLALDVLEHFPVFAIADLLAEWHRVLEPGGRLVMRAPNLLALADWLVAGRHVALVIRNIYGGHRWGPDGVWDAHHTGWTPVTLREDLTLAGFRIVREDHGLNMTFEVEVA